MDFASLMKAQINKGKAASTAPTGDKKTFLKRSEVEAQREAAYLKEQEELERVRAEKAAKKRKLEEEEHEKELEREDKRRKLAEESRKRREDEEEQEERERRKRIGLPELPPKGMNEQNGEDEDEDSEDLEDEELIHRLRDMKEPAKLFGEEHRDRLRRYKKLVEARATVKMSNGPIPTTIELVEEKDMKVPPKAPKDSLGKKFVYRQLASYFTLLLTEWEVTMAKRPDEVKESYSGKAALNAMIQARTNLVPFFRKLEAGDIDDKVLDGVLEIVNAAQERRYVDANDGYLRLSIGKAAWPIGVTMVGIHERSAREKLHESDKTAHIMSDEVTRKYLQSVKRCLSFAQIRWPPTDQLQLMG